MSLSVGAPWILDGYARGWRGHENALVAEFFGLAKYLSPTSVWRLLGRARPLDRRSEPTSLAAWGAAPSGSSLRVALERETSRGFPDVWLSFRHPDGVSERPIVDLLVEAKLNSEQSHPTQIEDYYAALETDFVGERRGLIYLTRDSEEAGNELSRGAARLQPTRDRPLFLLTWSELAKTLEEMLFSSGDGTQPWERPILEDLLEVLRCRGIPSWRAVVRAFQSLTEARRCLTLAAEQGAYMTDAKEGLHQVRLAYRHVAAHQALVSELFGHIDDRLRELGFIRSWCSIADALPATWSSRIDWRDVDRFWRHASGVADPELTWREPSSGDLDLGAGRVVVGHYADNGKGDSVVYAMVFKAEFDQRTFDDCSWEDCLRSRFGDLFPRFTTHPTDVPVPKAKDASHCWVNVKSLNVAKADTLEHEFVAPLVARVRERWPGE